MRNDHLCAKGHALDVFGRCECDNAPYGRNKNGVPNRPNDRVVIVVHCNNQEQAERWRKFIENEAPVRDALALPVVEVDCLP